MKFAAETDMLIAVFISETDCDSVFDVTGSDWSDYFAFVRQWSRTDSESYRKP